MPKSASKKQIILSLARELGLEQVKEPDLRRIQAGVHQRQTGSKGASLSYVASVLREAGFTVNYQDRFSDPVMPEPYASRLKDVLKFGDLPTAENALRTIHEIFCEYRNASDRKGTGLIRSMLLRGKDRAASLARNSRVNPEKRREKQEIAQWFQVWLQTPDLFFDWLELRKQSPEFPLHDPTSGSQSPNGGAPEEET